MVRIALLVEVEDNASHDRRHKGASTAAHF